MTHPSPERIAEHLEGVLEADVDEQVRAHLQRCAACTATARRLSEVPTALRAAAAEPAPAMPPDVAARIEAALAAETRAPSADRDEIDGRAGVSRGERHGQRRGRRRLAGGLLAAAAVTMVALGVSEVLDAGVGGSGGAGGSAVRAPAEGTGRPQAERGLGALEDGAVGPVSGRVWATLVDGVAAAHSSGEPRRERSACVAAALGDSAAARGSSYAVTVPGARGEPGVAGAVLLRPDRAPREGILVACEPRPRVLLRRGLAR